MDFRRTPVFSNRLWPIKTSNSSDWLRMRPGNEEPATWADVCHEMRVNLILLFYGSYLIHPAFGILEAEVGWDQYWSDLCDDKVDLSEEGQWDHFLQQARERFDGGFLFGAKTKPQDFVNYVFGLVYRRAEEIKGLYTAKMLLQYHPSFPISPSALLTMESYHPDMNEVKSGPAKNNFIDTIVMGRNLGIPLPEMYKNDAKTSLYLIGDDPLKRFSQCSLENFGPDSPLLSVKTLAAYLGDGAIDGEVDQFFQPLEGHRTAETACVMANLLNRLGNKKELLQAREFDSVAINQDVDLFLQAAGTEDYMRACAKYSDPEEIFETALLERLRDLDVDSQILLSIGFSQHAMLMSIKRTSKSRYELLIFNSGAGLKYHESSVSDSKRRVFPAKRFSNLTLLRLKWSQVLQRLYHVYAIGSKIIPNPEPAGTASSNAEDLYLTALAGLKHFEKRFTEEDMDRFRLFIAQRSGNCSVEVLMAFLAHDRKRLYQKQKIFIYKELIELTFQKQAIDEEWAVLKRLLKYGLENHARTVLRYLRSSGKQDGGEGEGKNLPSPISFGLLLPENIWRKYEEVADAYIPSKPTKFAMNTQGLKESSMFFEEIMNYARMQNMQFEKALHAEEKVKFLPPAECILWGNCIFNLINNSWRDHQKFANYLSALVDYMSNCRFKADEYETMVFLSFTVISKWPNPGAKEWNMLFSPQNEHHEDALRSLWLFVQRILKAQNAAKMGSIYLYACMHKIMMILQHALGQVYPGLHECRTGDLFLMTSSAHFCLSHSIAECFEKFSAPHGEICLNEGQPEGRLLEILEKLAKIHGFNYQVDFRDQPLAILREQKGLKIPLVLYYWHVVRNVVSRLASGAEYGWNRTFPQLCKESYRPTMDVKDQGNLKIGLSNYAIVTNPISSTQPRAVEVEKSDCNSFNDYKTYGDPVKIMSMVLMSKYDQLGKFVHLLQVLPEQFDWSTTLHLGALVVHRPQPLGTIVNAVSTLNDHLNDLRKDLYTNYVFLTRPPSTNIKMKVKAERYAALIILESIIAHKSANLQNSSGDMRNISAGLLNTRKHQSDLILFLRKDLHVEYRSIFVFAYLAAFPGDPELVEAEKAIVLNKEFQEVLRHHLPDPNDVPRYRDHLMANVMNAFYVIAQSPASANIIDNIMGHLNGARKNYGFISTTQATAENDVFDMVSGFEITQGFYTTNVSPESLQQYYDAAMVQDRLDGIKFNPIKYQSIGPGGVVRCSVGIGSRAFKRAFLHYELVNIDIWNSGDPINPTVVIRERYYVSGNGISEYRYAIRYPLSRIPRAHLPIPANVNNANPYHVLAFTKNNDVAFHSKSESIWANAEGQLTFHDPNLTDLQYMQFIHENDFISPLATRSEAFCFRDSNGAWRLLLKNYADANGNPLWFIREKDEKWELLSDRKFHIAHDQNFTTAGMLPKYLLLEGLPNTFKIILPEEFYQLHGMDSDEETRKNCQSISLTRTARKYSKTDYHEKLTSKDKNEKTIPSLLPHPKSRQESTYQKKVTSKVKQDHTIPSLVPHPKSRQESMLLLYNYVVTRHYHEAMKEADKIHQMEPFDEEEYKILGWIAKSHSAMKNGSPESIAIRGFICFHVFNNVMLFHSLGDPDPSFTDEGPYMPASKWPAFWAAKHLEISSAVISRYVDRMTKIPIFLRFDPDSSFPRISAAQWKAWIQTLLESNSTSSLKLHLFPVKGTQFILSANNYDGSVERFGDAENILQILKDSPQIDEPFPSKSFLSPSILMNRKNWLMARILSRQLALEMYEKLDQWLQPYENIVQFAIVARILRKALIISRKQQLRSDEMKKIIDKLFAEQSISPQSSAPNENDILQSDMREFKDKKYEYPLNTPSIEDRIFGVPFRLAKIKKKICASGEELNSVLDPLIGELFKTVHFNDISPKYFTDFEHKLELLQKSMKLYELYLLSLFKARVEQDYKHEPKHDYEIVNRLRHIAHGKIDITTQDIIHMYAKAEEQLYRQYFPYFEGKIEELHQIATEIVLVHSNWQEIKRLRQLYPSNKEKSEEKSGKFELKSCMRTRSTDTSMTNMLAYECYINSRLTKKQKDKIIDLTTKYAETDKYPDKFVHWIMSGGKTYILGTLLSVMKADHTHLSILVVPKSLLTGEASNLFSRTIAAFNRNGLSFRLSRDPKLANLKTIAWIKESISNAINRGQYIIMSSDMLESLHDKFVELGDGKNTELEYEEMRKLLEMIHDSGAMTVDEAHKIFDPTQETNFPIVSSKGNKADGTKTLALESRVLAEMFRLLVEDNGLKVGLSKLNNFNIAENSLLNPSEGEKISKSIGLYLANAITARTGRVFNYLNSLDPDGLASIKESQLQKFLATDSKDLKRQIIQDIRSNVSDSLYRALAVCRLAVTTLIPLAWSGNVNEHYGLEPGKKYSIPYSAAFAPKIGSEFAFRWYCYARTIRTYLVKGFDDMTIKWSIAWLQQWALQEMTKKVVDEEQSVPETLISQLFAIDSPFDIDTNSDDQMRSILEKCAAYHHSSVRLGYDKSHLYFEFLFRWIAEDVIPSVNYYTNQISTNSQDISYMVSSRQLYSGSVVSFRTFPREFMDSQKTKIDERIDTKIKKAIKKNHLGVTVVPSGLSALEFVQNPKVLLARSKIENKFKSPVVAVLDVGAYFKDQLNEQVATSLLEFQESVLYFSTEKNKLALITKEDPKERLIHTYSAEILRELVQDESKRITFYDQQHNTGVDIFQQADGCALIIIGAKTTSIDFYQSTMRMRKFLKTQKIYIMVPKHVAKIISQVENDEFGPDIEDILKFMEKNLEDSIINLNALALSQMIAAVFKEAAYKRLLKNDIDKKVLKLWVKDTSSDVKDLIVPQVDLPYFEGIVPKIIDSYALKVKGYLDDENIEKLKAAAWNTVKMAFADGGGKYYPDKSLISESSPEGNMMADDVKGLQMLDNMDSDMLAIASVEVEAENEQEVYIWAPPKFLNDSVDWRSALFPLWTLEDERGFGRNLQKLGKIYRVNNLLDVYTRQDSNKGLQLFSDSLMVTTGYLQRGTLFGRNRSFIPHCLVLTDKNPNVGEFYVVIVDPIEADEIAGILDFRQNNEIFGYHAVLVDPIRHTVDVGLVDPSRRTVKHYLSENGTIPAEITAILDEVIFFAGYLEQIAKSEFKSSLLKVLTSFESSSRYPQCLGANGNMQPFKAALFNEVILSKEEYEEKRNVFPGKTSLVEYAGISPEGYDRTRKEHQLALYNFLSRNKSRLSTHMQDLQKQARLYGLYDLIKNNIYMPVFDENELFEAMKHGLNKFFEDTELRIRHDFQENISAIVDLYTEYEQHFAKLIVTGMTKILQERAEEFFDWRHYKPLFQAISKNISLDSSEEVNVEQSAEDYIDAVKNFPNRQIKDFLITKQEEVKGKSKGKKKSNRQSPRRDDGEKEEETEESRKPGIFKRIFRRH